MMSKTLVLLMCLFGVMNCEETKQDTKQAVILPGLGFPGAVLANGAALPPVGPVFPNGAVLPNAALFPYFPVNPYLVVPEMSWFYFKF